MSDLNQRERLILEYITEYNRKKGFPPTTRDICAALHIPSTSTVNTSMHKLAEAGFIIIEAGKHKYIVVDQDSPELHTEVSEVPIVGRVAAGQPILAEQNIEGYFPIPAEQMGRGNTFMLQVHGDSMIEAGILNGDYILVEEQNHANNGDIVVAIVENFDSEATVKAFYKEDGHIRLQPRNCEMDPIIVKDCRIVGKVRGVFRYMN